MKQGTTNADRAALVSRLTHEEHEIYLWLLQCFSIAWIAETLEVEKRQVKVLAKKVFKTLDVINQWELVRYYAPLNRSKPPAPAIPPEELACILAFYPEYRRGAAP
jgi:DNA-binding CsgD family transcriptional regulator